MLSVVPPVAFSGPLLAQAVFWYSAGGLALISFVGLFWVKVVRPFDHAVTALRQFVPALPGLIEMQEQFKPNGGGSLRDRVDYIATEAECAKALAADTAQKQTELAQRIEEATQLLAERIEARSSEIAQKVEDRARLIADEHQSAIAEFRSHIVEINQKEIAMLADQSAHLGVLPLESASDRAIVPREPGDEPPEP